MVKVKALNILFILCFLILIAVAEAAETRYDIPLKGSPSWGPENALITIVEFIDYQ